MRQGHLRIGQEFKYQQNRFMTSINQWAPGLLPGLEEIIQECLAMYHR